VLTAPPRDLTAQYLTAAEVLLTPPAVLARRAKLSLAETSQVVHELSLAVCAREGAQDKTLAEIVEQDAREGHVAAMTTGDTGLDELLGGGLRAGTVTEIAGHSQVRTVLSGC
jgi:predicted ATP-dependent serine protease